MMNSMADIFERFLVLDPEIMLRILVAMVLSGIIGLEREFHGRPAGLRTHILVCVGATVIMLSAEPLLGIYSNLVDNYRIQIDPGRAVAGIVTGIGFLGAGAIIKSGDVVRGLTTSACIWFAATLGIVIGEGAYSLGIFSTIMVLFSLYMLNKIEHFILNHVHRNLIISTTCKYLQKVNDEVRTVLVKNKVSIRDRLLHIDRTANDARMTYHIHVKESVNNLEITNQLLTIEEIKEISWNY